MERKYSLWSGDKFVLNLGRWALWKESFNQISMGSVPGDFEDETRLMAKEGMGVMQKIEDQMKAPSQT